MSQESSSALSSRARELLRAERSASEPEALRERALARAIVTYEAERAARDNALILPAPRSRRPRVLMGLGVAATIAVAGLAAASVGFWEPGPSVVPAASLAAPPARVVPRPLRKTADPPAEAEVTRAPAPAVVARRAQVSASGGSASSPVGKPPIARQYSLELAVLEPARSAVARGDFGAALAAAAEHQRQFPSGLLSEERSALRVRALWASGRVDEANAAAAAFRQRYPRSVLLAWMKQK